MRHEKGNGKNRHLVFAVLGLAGLGITLFSAAKCYWEGAASNAPDWPMYVLLSLLWAVNTVSWFVSWLRYDRNSQEKS